MQKFDLEWVDGSLQSELRWGIRKKENGPLINSTRIATITRDGDKITDAGSQAVYVVKLGTLFSVEYLEGDAGKFANIIDAKRTALALISDTFAEMHSVAHTLRTKTNHAKPE